MTVKISKKTGYFHDCLYFSRKSDLQYIHFQLRRSARKFWRKKKKLEYFTCTCTWLAL